MCTMGGRLAFEQKKRRMSEQQEASYQNLSPLHITHPSPKSSLMGCMYRIRVRACGAAGKEDYFAFESSGADGLAVGVIGIVCP